MEIVLTPLARSIVVFIYLNFKLPSIFLYYIQLVMCY
jgi:hypothetical protein